MKKRKRPGSGLGILLLTAVLICSAVRPVSAEEPGEEEEKPVNTPITSTYAATLSEEANNEETISEEEQNAETNYEEGTRDAEQKTGDTEQKTRDAEQKTTEGNVTLPSATEHSFIWDGGLLRVPVDLGSYTSDDLRLVLRFPALELEYAMTWEGEYAAYSPEIHEGSFGTEGGRYYAVLEFYMVDESGESLIRTESIIVSVLASSDKWQAEEKLINFDGSQDLTFSFKNGINEYELKSISSIEIFMWKGTAIYGENPSLESGFTFDMSAGTLTIDKIYAKHAIIEAVEEARGRGLKEYPTHAYINAYAVTASGEEICFNTIDKVENDSILETPAWELDLTEFNWDAEELQIVPEATDYVYMKGDRGGATIECTGALEDFVSVFVDGALVDRSNYTLESGSTILTFTTKYLNTLSAGKHTVTMNYTYGSVNTELTVRERKSSGGGSGGSGSGSTARPVSSDPTASVTPQEPAVSANPTETATPTNAVNSSNASGSVTSVQTGDSTAFILWIVAAIFASGICGVLGWRRYSGKI